MKPSNKIVLIPDSDLGNANPVEQKYLKLMSYKGLIIGKKDLKPNNNEVKILNVLSSSLFLVCIVDPLTACHETTPVEEPDASGEDHNAPVLLLFDQQQQGTIRAPIINLTSFLRRHFPGS